jgi:glycosyltransferase involved in cell wall biosynthesis
MDVLLLPSQKNSMPLFSIIIPVFNRYKPLEKALDSVLSQTVQDFEVLIVDDGSNSSVASLIKQLVADFSDDRLQLLVHPSNKNGAAARNTGIQAASGKYLCFLDSDDYWKPSKLKAVLSCIHQNNKSKEFLIHHQYCNSENGLYAEALPKIAKGKDETVAHYSFVTNNVGGIQSSTICVPRALAQDCLFDERFKGHQDWDFALKIGEVTSEFYFINEPLTIRCKDFKDSVADSLSWRYSLWFYSQCACYFDSVSALYFLERVVLRKAIFSLLLFSPLINQLTCRLLIFRPLKIVKVMYKYGVTTFKLKKRIQSLKCECKKIDAQNVMIWGANDYARAILLSFGDQLKFTKIIDAKAKSLNEQFLGINITSLQSITIEEFAMVDIIILATDKHQQSMKNDLAEIDSSLLKKVLAF